MKKKYNAPILFELTPGGEGSATGEGSGQGDNFMRWSDWKDHNPGGTEEQYIAYCDSYGMDPIWE